VKWSLPTRFWSFARKFNQAVKFCPSGSTVDENWAPGLPRPTPNSDCVALNFIYSTAHLTQMNCKNNTFYACEVTRLKNTVIFSI
jgi:hypothetical protein